MDTAGTLVAGRGWGTWSPMNNGDRGAGVGDTWAPRH